MSKTQSSTPPSYKYDLFISHSTADAVQVADLARLLTEIDIGVWLDCQKDLPGSITDAVDDAIRLARYFCCFLSEHTNSSWIEHEVNTFFKIHGDQPDRLILCSLSNPPRMPPTLQKRGDLYVIDLATSLLNGFYKLSSRITIRNSGLSMPNNKFGLLKVYRQRTEVTQRLWETLYRNAKINIDLIGHSMAPIFYDGRDKVLVLPALQRRVAMRLLLLDPSEPESQQPKEVQARMQAGTDIIEKIQTTIRYVRALQRDIFKNRLPGSLEYKTTSRIIYSTFSIFDGLAIVTPYSNQTEAGDQSPTFLLGKLDDSSDHQLFDFYYDEFNRYWDSSPAPHRLPVVDVVRPYKYAGTFWDDHGSKFPNALNGSCPPAQVEIHPPSQGSMRCWLQCPHCYGDGEATPKDDPTKLDVDTAVKVIREIKTQVRRIIISGTYSDPLNSSITPALLRAAREQPAQTIGVHTKLLKLDFDLENALLDGCQVDDYIAISVDAGTPRTYDLVHGVRRDPAKPSGVLDTVRANLLRLSGHVHQRQLPLRINLTYLLTDKSTQDSNDVESAIDLAIEAGVDVIRFSVPQPPTLAPANRKMVSQTSIERARKIISDRKLAREGSKPVIYLTEFSDWKLTDFSRCYSQLFHPAIGGDGYLYPCCQVASENFANLRIGNLRSDSFWTLWHGDKRRQLLEMDTGDRQGKDSGKMNCRVCNRKDGAINTMLGRKFSER